MQCLVYQFYISANKWIKYQSNRKTMIECNNGFSLNHFFLFNKIDAILSFLYRNYWDSPPQFELNLVLCNKQNVYLTPL